MSFNLRNRSLDLARDLKRAKYARTEQEPLKGKEVCLIFDKTSTRTRCAFEVACHGQGATVSHPCQIKDKRADNRSTSRYCHQHYL